VILVIAKISIIWHFFNWSQPLLSKFKIGSGASRSGELNDIFILIGLFIIFVICKLCKKAKYIELE